MIHKFLRQMCCDRPHDPVKCCFFAELWRTAWTILKFFCPLLPITFLDLKVLFSYRYLCYFVLHASSDYTWTIYIIGLFFKYSFLQNGNVEISLFWQTYNHVIKSLSWFLMKISIIGLRILYRKTSFYKEFFTVH